MSSEEVMKATAGIIQAMICAQILLSEKNVIDAISTVKSALLAA